MYQVTIKGKGAMVDAFREEGIFVTFGDNAPDTLKDFCYSIDVNPVDGEVTPGCKLVIDGKEFKIVKSWRSCQRESEEFRTCYI